MTMLTQASETLAMEDSEKYKDYTKNEIIEEVEIVDADYHSTLCSDCRAVCHNHCSLQETELQGLLDDDDFVDHSQLQLLAVCIGSVNYFCAM